MKNNMELGMYGKESHNKDWLLQVQSWKWACQTLGETYKTFFKIVHQISSL